ncbi:hypothetical protein A5742_24450 [Mycolicibacterium fortuitum]|uniref:Uncharacterized protein n=1 Tax=Mycolicibacterium fortuitum TaxID=1766 RepID=A0ABD6QNT1_MYCFO|nr:hypothetical protein [Mycolicibacterium fortuitum]OMC47367.1 hypothetical protein A5742_24450 [Mycolicibacterium fortuitum]
MGKNNGNKQLPQCAGRPQRKQVKQSAAPLEAIDNQDFAWSAGEIDHQYAGEWAWDLTPKDIADLLKLLEELSRLTWREVKAMTTGGREGHKKHHDQPVSSICTQAQQRLGELQVDVERVFRLRHGSAIRIWGYLAGPVFRILWYDREHKVYPTERN